MENRSVDLEVVKIIAEGLDEFKDQVVFVGGAMVGVYGSEISRNEVRPTMDVDLAVNLTTYSQWASIQEDLSNKGFHLDPKAKTTVRFIYRGIAVDIMPAYKGIMGKSNKWYQIGFQNLKKLAIQDVVINVFSAPVFVATKFEAFLDRGKEDYLESDDIEDIIYVLNYCDYLISEFQEESNEVKNFLHEQLQLMLDKNVLDPVLSFCVESSILNDRKEIILGKIDSILGGS